MATVDERMQILKMIEEGKISAEEGEKLLCHQFNIPCEQLREDLSFSLPFDDRALQKQEEFP